MRLADSAIFDGTDSTLDPSKPVNATRTISVYVPAQYQDGTAAPVLVIQDGPGELSLVKNALDNLTVAQDAARRIPPFIAVAVQNGGNDSKGSERGLEYDTMSDRYARFIHLEVLPAVEGNARSRPPIRISGSPETLRKSGARLQLRRCRRAHHGLVSPRPIQSTAHVLGNLRRSARRRCARRKRRIHSARGITIRVNAHLKLSKETLRIFLNVNQDDLGSTEPE